MFRVGKEEVEALERVIYAKSFFKDNNALRETANAEADLREKFGTPHALFMTSGHAALSAALVAAGIGPGDEVIVPAYTYIATAIAVIEAGAIPIIADVDETLTLCPRDFEKKISKHTKGVIPVHIQGFPCDMDAINAIAKKHGIFVLEDSCQGDGGTYKGKRLGTVGDAGVLSFNFFKIISCGEGGALLTQKKDIYDKALIYHDSSAVAFFGNQLDGVECDLFCGREYRANEVNAALLRVQLTRLDGILADLRSVKERIVKMIGDACTFAPSNDPLGDVCTTLAMQFKTVEEAISFCDKCKTPTRRPINTGKHVYTNWTPIMEKRGALNPLMDPYKMEANKDIVPNYTPDMCQKTLDILARTVYIAINPEWTDEDIASVAQNVKQALR